MSNILGCFQRPFITYPRCDNQAGFCGLDVTAIPGVTLLKVSAVAEADALRAEQLFEKLEGEAINTTYQDFLYALPKQNIQFRSVIDTLYKGDFGENYLPAENKFYSFRVKRKCTDKLLCMRLRQIQIKVGKINPITKTLYIDDGGTIIEKTITLTSGINTINLDYLSMQDSVRVYMNFCDIPINIPDGYNDKLNCNCNDSCKCSSCSNGNYWITFEEGTTNDCAGGDCLPPECTVEWTEIGNAHMQICVDVVCCPESFFCAYKSELAPAIRYRFAALIMQETLESSRMNPLVRNNKDSADRVYTRMMGGEYKDGRKEANPSYWQALENAVSSVAYSILNSGSTCIECKGAKVVDSTP